jgi:thiamine-phosphate pyrophosphorylase
VKNRLNLLFGLKYGTSSNGMEQTLDSFAGNLGTKFGVLGGSGCCGAATNAPVIARTSINSRMRPPSRWHFRRRLRVAVCRAAAWLTEYLLRYFITDRRLCGGLPALLEIIRSKMAAGIEYIQIREKDLSAREVWTFASAVVSARGSSGSKILVNDRADVVMAAGANGVHLPSRAPFETLPGLIIARSCHTEEEVRTAKADFVTFSPVFASPGKGPPVGLDQLRNACRYPIPVFALGGVTWENATACIEAGATGVAGIRLFLSD